MTTATATAIDPTIVKLADELNVVTGQRASAEIAADRAASDNMPVDRVTVPVLMSDGMKNAVDAHATSLNMTTSAYIRNLIGADINWDMSVESRKPRATKYATPADAKLAAKLAADARRKLASELIRKHRAEIVAAEKRAAVAALAATKRAAKSARK